MGLRQAWRSPGAVRRDCARRGAALAQCAGTAPGLRQACARPGAALAQCAVPI